jgi:hypothetical protein
MLHPVNVGLALDACARRPWASEMRWRNAVGFCLRPVCVGSRWTGQHGTRIARVAIDRAEGECGTAGPEMPNPARRGAAGALATAERSIVHLSFKCNRQFPRARS